MLGPRPRASAASRTRSGALIAILLVGILAGCQPPGPSPATPSILPTDARSAPASPAPSLEPPPEGTVTVDPSLLSILPSEVGGAPMIPAEEAATDIAVDPSLATDVEAIAVALAVSPGSSGNQDLVIANVVRLRPDVFDEEFFRSWRDTYDAAACEPAGGLLGNAEAEIDERNVFIGSCTNGGFTYHVRYGENVIVSLTSLGDGRFGELVVKNLGK